VSTPEKDAAPKSFHFYKSLTYNYVTTCTQNTIHISMVKDIKFEVQSIAELKERAIYKDPNSAIHYSRQKAKDPNDEREQFFELPKGGVKAQNCESVNDFIHRGTLCIETPTAGSKRKRKRIGRSLVWSLPDSLQALLWNLKKKELGETLLFLFKSFRDALRTLFKSAPMLCSIHCDKARFHFEALVLKYDIITNQRGKLEARMYKEFEGYKADSATRTAQVATAITSGGSDPGFRRINSRLTRHLTKQANNEITRVCLKQTNTNAAEFANNALETFRALRYIRAPKSPSKRAFWADLAFPQMPKQNLSQKKKMTEEFTAFLNKANGPSPEWLLKVCARAKAIKERAKAIKEREESIRKRDESNKERLQSAIENIRSPKNKDNQPCIR
jgi:hypothetical protein